MWCEGLPDSYGKYRSQENLAKLEIMSVHALSLSPTHSFSKQSTASLRLLPNLGVEGDSHCGETVQHRSRLHIKPPPKNLRQVHLLDLEIEKELNVAPGDLGENITTTGLRLLGLGQGTKLHFLPPTVNATESMGSLGKSDHPILVVSGLRNPCPQISHFRSGLQELFLERDDQRQIVGRRAGIMSTVEVGGIVNVGMQIVVEEPAMFKQLECV